MPWEQWEFFFSRIKLTLSLCWEEKVQEGFRNVYRLPETSTESGTTYLYLCAVFFIVEYECVKLRPFVLQNWKFISKKSAIRRVLPVKEEGKIAHCKKTGKVAAYFVQLTSPELIRANTSRDLWLLQMIQISVNFICVQSGSYMVISTLTCVWITNGFPNWRSFLCYWSSDHSDEVQKCGCAWKLCYWQIKLYFLVQHAYLLELTRW